MTGDTPDEARSAESTDNAGAEDPTGERADSPAEEREESREDIK